MMVPAAYPDGLELRAAAEVRAVGRHLEGYAAVFNTEAAVGNFRESIRIGAFRASLASGRDVLALVDHDPSRLLARSKSGTLKLREDERGLAFTVSVPNTQLGADILAMAERNDIGGASFGFRVTSEKWLAADRRELVAVELVEVSVVQAFPAYASTTVSARSRDLGAAVLRRRYLDLV